MRQHLPLAATAVQIQERVEYLPHVEFPGAATPVAAGRWNQGLHDRPLGVREIRWIRLSFFLLPWHPCALLCLLRLTPPFYHIFCQNQFPESLSEHSGTESRVSGCPAAPAEAPTSVSRTA